MPSLRHLATLTALAGKYIRPLGYIVALLGRSARQTPETWDRQYAEGQWAYMRNLTDLGRYSVIVGYIAKLKPHGAVLDIGCGEGILQQKLKPYYGRYLGIDIASEAIRRAERYADPTTTFHTADAATFEVREKFDVIIFNETLFYFVDPASVMSRYRDMLKDDGIFVLSTSAFAKCLPVWRAVERMFFIVDEVVIYHRSGLAWVVQLATPLSALRRRAMRPPGRDAPTKQADQRQALRVSERTFLSILFCWSRWALAPVGRGGARITTLHRSRAGCAEPRAVRPRQLSSRGEASAPYG